MKYIDYMNNIYNDLKNGIYNINLYDITKLNTISMDLLDNSYPKEKNQEYIDTISLLIKISNIIYNNSTLECPLDDGVYDRLMNIYKKICPDDYVIGERPVKIINDTFDSDSLDNRIKPIITLSSDIEDRLFYDDLIRDPNYLPDDYRLVDRTNYIPQKSNSLRVPHMYPKLAGTLDKCIFVLNKDAKEFGVYDSDQISIFERDFLGKHIDQGIVNPNDITLILELKYDGMSVEADVTDHIISARSRGNTQDDLCESLDMLKGYEFPNAKKLNIDKPFGMKFECIIRKDNLEYFGLLKNKNYKNCRNGIVGLMKSIDAQAYRDLITLVPLETSEDVDPIQEIEFMNKFYTKDVYLKYTVIRGNYTQVMYQVYEFVKEAMEMREYFPFMYDGVVVHYYDNNIRKKLGRKNFVNQYSTAIKFTPSKKTCTFLGYTYTVGQNGVITPLIHYSPIDFLGTIHTKSSGHSFGRFKTLNLSVGDKIEVEYKNDVMPYVVGKVPNNRNDNEPEQFPRYCPECGNKLKFKNSIVYCDNFFCPGRTVVRISNMMKKLNIKGFADQFIKKLGYKNLRDVFSVQSSIDAFNYCAKTIGKGNAINLKIAIDQFLNTPIYDYKLIGSIGFSNIAVESWKKIIQKINPLYIIKMTDKELSSQLNNIKGIGGKTIQAIIDERKYFIDDIKFLLSFPNIKSSTGIDSKNIVRFSGIRPTDDIIRELNIRGIDADPNGGVTKKTTILVVPNVGYESVKTRKVNKEICKIIPYDEFVKNLDDI